MLLSEYIHSQAPLSVPLANEMCEFVFAACEKEGCGCARLVSGDDDADDFRFTREFCRSHGLDENEIVAWLEGGDVTATYCDCGLMLGIGIWFMPNELFDPASDPEVDDDGNEIASATGEPIRWEDDEPQPTKGAEQNDEAHT